MFIDTSPTGPHLPGHSVMPSAPGSLSVRLTGGHVASEGRVEIFEDNQWKAVCDVLWNEYNANVVCKELGYYSGTPISR